jgi:aerobic carbon-monoxide dehydrogenase large subunit
LPEGFEIGLSGVGDHPGPNTFPNGCMICEVEIELETGQAEITQLSAVDDVGAIINPLTLEGQLHGSVAQGVGEALFEQVVYSPDTGQLVTGSFMDYAMPRAQDIPAVRSDYILVPTKSNLLGAKGGSEAGNVGAPPAVINAIVDALSDWNISDIALPATSETIWKLVHEQPCSGSDADS